MSGIDLANLVAVAAIDRNRVRRETGKEQMVRVHYDEGAAIHIGSSPFSLIRGASS
jgi:hypothetical protein